MELLDPQLSGQPNTTHVAATVSKPPVNIRKEVFYYLKKWPWVLLSMALFYTAARIYLRYTQPVYLSKTSLMLPQSKTTNTALSDLKNLGMGVSDNNELQGETVIITSKPILSQVVRNLGLNISYYSQGSIKESEIYGNSPIRAELISLNHPDAFGGASMVITGINARRFKITEGAGAGKEYAYGRSFNPGFGQVMILNKAGRVQHTPLKIVFRSESSVVAGLESSVNVSLPENKGMLMELSMMGTVPKKSEDILNEIARQYNIDGVKDKNLEAQNTQDFINGRLVIISEDLSGIESEKENFKRSNHITDLDAMANMALGNINSNTKTYLDTATRLELVNAIDQMASREQMLPSNMGLSAAAEEALGKYNELLLTRNRVLKQASNINPAVVQLNREIAETHALLKKNLNESRQALQLQLSQVRGQLNEDRGVVDRYPTQEKIFRNIDRQQQLKEQLYLYLLQKREENAINMAVTAPKSKVVNPAYTIGQIKPNNRQITTGALAAGFILPLAVFFLISFTDHRVYTKDQVAQQLPHIPVIGEIPVSTDSSALVQVSDFSPYAEAFRIMVSNLKYLLKIRNERSQGVILVTSSVKGEGKTTVAMNTALTLAGKNRVFLLGADIRNPQLHRFMHHKNIGLTDFLVSEKDDYRAFVQKSQLHESLDVMFSGAMAPNPNDLLDMAKFDTLIQQLKTEYDYVVIDTAPVMLVSDTLSITDVADSIVYVVKSGFTDRDMLRFTEEFQQRNHLTNMALVINEVKLQDSRYGSKYGYGYYHDTGKTEKKAWWKR